MFLLGVTKTDDVAACVGVMMVPKFNAVCPGGRIDQSVAGRPGCEYPPRPPPRPLPLLPFPPRALFLLFRDDTELLLDFVVPSDTSSVICVSKS